jgi:hypothetical protein
VTPDRPSLYIRRPNMVIVPIHTIPYVRGQVVRARFSNRPLGWRSARRAVAAQGWERRNEAPRIAW